MLIWIIQTWCNCYQEMALLLWNRLFQNFLFLTRRFYNFQLRSFSIDAFSVLGSRIFQSCPNSFQRWTIDSWSIWWHHDLWIKVITQDPILKVWVLVDKGILDSSSRITRSHGHKRMTLKTLNCWWISCDLHYWDIKIKIKIKLMEFNRIVKSYWIKLRSLILILILILNCLWFVWSWCLMKAPKTWVQNKLHDFLVWNELAIGEVCNLIGWVLNSQDSWMIWNFKLLNISIIHWNDLELQVAEYFKNPKPFFRRPRGLLCERRPGGPP